MKTTDFGAFVELKKGTDGLLHVSNVGPGRVAHIEDVISRGDILDVKVVQEVDKARGRIGLKLVAKHEDGALVQPEELIERAKSAPPRERERSVLGTTIAGADETADAATAARAAKASESHSTDYEEPADGDPRRHGLLERHCAEEHSERGDRIGGGDGAGRPEGAQADVPGHVAEERRETPR